MGLTTDDYLQHLQALLPQGPAWSRDPDAVITQQLSAWAEELARVDARSLDLITEADPRTTSELLTDWERVAGLPDPCVTADQTIEQRRAALVSKLISLGGQSRQYFLALAKAFGYEGASITEYRPMNCTDDCNDNLASEADRSVWTLNLPATSGIFYMNSNSPCASPLAAWGDQAIECRISRYKPANTTVIFAYP